MRSRLAPSFCWSSFIAPSFGLVLPLLVALGSASTTAAAELPGIELEPGQGVELGDPIEVEGGVVVDPSGPTGGRGLVVGCADPGPGQPLDNHLDRDGFIVQGDNTDCVLIADLNFKKRAYGLPLSLGTLAALKLCLQARSAETGIPTIVPGGTVMNEESLGLLAECNEAILEAAGLGGSGGGGFSGDGWTTLAEYAQFVATVCPALVGYLEEVEEEGETFYEGGAIVGLQAKGGTTSHAYEVSEAWEDANGKWVFVVHDPYDPGNATQMLLDEDGTVTDLDTMETFWVVSHYG